MQIQYTTATYEQSEDWTLHSVMRRITHAKSWHLLSLMGDQCGKRASKVAFSFSICGMGKKQWKTFTYLFHRDECKKLRIEKDFCPSLVVDSPFLSKTAEDVYKGHQRPEKTHKLWIHLVSKLTILLRIEHHMQGEMLSAMLQELSSSIILHSTIGLLFKLTQGPYIRDTLTLCGILLKPIRNM